MHRRWFDATSFAPSADDAAAGVRHRDPLRIWLAQIVADLQRPSSTSALRLRQWLHALESARDEEAREGGASGEALAAAVVQAARFGSSRMTAAAHLAGEPEFLRDRIARLLRPNLLHRPGGRRGLALLLAGGFLFAMAAGVLQGESALRWLSGRSNEG